MIGYLKGKIIEKNIHSVLVLVQGIGYEVFISEKVYTHLGEKNDEAELLIYTHVREDAIELFGFIDSLEKKLFFSLMSVSGIGAKSAIQILGKSETSALIKAIIENNSTYLTKLPGIGKKTANRIIVELSDKLREESHFSCIETEKSVDNTSEISDVLIDVIEGLKGLGYSEKEIMPVLNQIEEKDKSTETLFKIALSKLARRR